MPINATWQSKNFRLLAKLKYAIEVIPVRVDLRGAQLIARHKKRRVFGEAGGFHFNPLLVAFQVKRTNIKTQTVPQCDRDMLHTLRQIGQAVVL